MPPYIDSSIVGDPAQLFSRMCISAGGRFANEKGLVFGAAGGAKRGRSEEIDWRMVGLLLEVVVGFLAGGAGMFLDRPRARQLIYVDDSFEGTGDHPPCCSDPLINASPPDAGIASVAPCLPSVEATAIS